MLELAKYSFVNAKIRALLSFLLDSSVLARLSEANNIHAIFDTLKNTAYKGIAEKVLTGYIDLEAVEKELLENDLRIYKKVHKMIDSSAEKQFVSILIDRYEIEEIKTVIRAWHKRIPVDLKDYIFDEKANYNINFEKIISSQTIEEIILLLDHTPYKQALMLAKDKFKEKKAPFYLEAALDRDYYKRLLDAAEKFSAQDKQIARKILGIEIDIENINALIGLRKYYSLSMATMMDVVIEGGEKINKDTIRKFYVTDGLAKIVEGVAFGPYAKVKDLVEKNAYFVENFLYEIILREIKKILAGFPFTIGTVLGYLILKRKETKNITSLLYAKSLGMERDETVSFLNI